MNEENNFKIDPITGKSTFVNPPSLPDVNSNEALGSGNVTKLLGYGGMANVYEIWDPQLEVFRAVKVIKPDCSKEALERFYTEIKITAKLNHPNIIDIHSVGVWKGLPYIEMERIEGTTLRDIIDETGALSPKICTAIGIMVCRALIYAHSQEYSIYGKTYSGIIHRDLKPGNIMICPDGQLKLMDFGIARPVEASFHTLDGTLVGTIQYMPPELLKGEPIDVRTDVYALGVTLYEILTGINAFPESNFSKLVFNKQKNLFQPLNRFKIIIPGKLRRLIHKCMQQDRRKRVEVIQTVLDELEKVHKRITNEKPEQILERFSSDIPRRKYIPPIGMAIPWNTIITAFIILGIIGLAVHFSMTVFEYLTLNDQLQKTMEKVRDEGSQSIEEFTSKIRSLELKRKKEALEQTDTERESKRISAPKVYERKLSAKDHSKDKPVVSSKKRDGATQNEKVEISKSVKPVGFLKRLELEYGTRNILELFGMEYKAGNLDNALKLYDRMTPAQINQPRSKIYKLRILKKMKRTKELAAFLDANTVNDGEFMLAKGQLAYKRNQIIKAKMLLNKALNIPISYSDYSTIKQDVNYYNALCASRLFYNKPTERNYLKALEEWRNLGALFSNNRDHPYYKKYREETRKIGEKYRTIEGGL